MIASTLYAWPNIQKKIRVWAPTIFVFFALIVLYGFTATTRLTWENFGSDGGDFLAAILTGGIPHPTGYPTYMILGRIMQWLPIGDAYFRSVLLSFLPSALAAGFLCKWINTIRPKSFLPGIAAGLCWGLSPLLWSQSVIIEVYGLQALFTILALWWLKHLFRIDEDHSRAMIFLAAAFGIGLGNHVTILLFFPACLAGGVYWVVKTGRKRMGLFQIGAMLLGMLVYVYLPIQARQFPPINWGNPQTLAGFLWEITAQPYQSLLGSVSLTIIANRVLAAAALLGKQVGFVGLALGIIGGVHLYQVDRKSGWVSLWVFFSYLVFSIVYNTADSIAYLIPVIMIYCGWIGFALDALKGLYWRGFSLLLVAAFLILGELLIRTPATIRQISPQSEYSAADFAEMTLSRLPENAIVLTSTDLDSFPLWAYHFGFGLRKDLSMIALPLTQYDWYRQTLSHIYPELQLPPASSIWEKQIGSLNTEHILCKGAVKNSEKIEIIFTCTNGTEIDFPSTR